MPAGRVLASLWPESDGDNATHAFEMTLLRLRNQLGEHGRRALRVDRGHVLLDPTLCWTDTAALVALLGEVGALEPETTSSPARLARSTALAERLSSLYRGPFADEDDAVSPIGEFGERLRGKVGSAARALGARLAQLDAAARAESFYLQLLERDVLLDSLLSPAMRCLVQSGRGAEARALLDARLRRPETVSSIDRAEVEETLRNSSGKALQ